MAVVAVVVFRYSKSSRFDLFQSQMATRVAGSGSMSVKYVRVRIVILVVRSHGAGLPFAAAVENLGAASVAAADGSLVEVAADRALVGAFAEEVDSVAGTVPAVAGSSSLRAVAHHTNSCVALTAVAAVGTTDTALGAESSSAVVVLHIRPSVVRPQNSNFPCHLLQAALVPKECLGTCPTVAGQHRSELMNMHLPCGLRAFGRNTVPPSTACCEDRGVCHACSSSPHRCVPTSV